MGIRVTRSAIVAAMVASLALAGCAPSAEEKAAVAAKAKASAEAKADAELKAAGAAYLRIVKPRNENLNKPDASTLDAAKQDCQTLVDLTAKEMRALNAYRWPTAKVASLVQTRIVHLAKQRAILQACRTAESWDDLSEVGAEMDNLPVSGAADLIRLELKLPATEEEAPTAAPASP